MLEACTFRWLSKIDILYCLLFEETINWSFYIISSWSSTMVTLKHNSQWHRVEIKKSENSLSSFLRKIVEKEYNHITPLTSMGYSDSLCSWLSYELSEIPEGKIQYSPGFSVGMDKTTEGLRVAWENQQSLELLDLSKCCIWIRTRKTSTFVLMV